jgi:hypothetical protein
MRSMMIGCALLLFGSYGAMAQDTPATPTAPAAPAVTTPSTPAPTVNSPADTSAAAKKPMMHKRMAHHGMMMHHKGMMMHHHMMVHHRHHMMRRHMGRHHKMIPAVKNRYTNPGWPQVRVATRQAQRRLDPVTASAAKPSGSRRASWIAASLRSYKDDALSLCGCAGSP